MEDEPNQQSPTKPPQILQTLSKASEDLKSRYLYIQVDINSPTIKAFLELESKLTQDPDLSKLSHHLTHLKTLINKIKSSQDYTLRSFIRRRYTGYEITRIAWSIAKEVKALGDRESVESLVKVLQESSDEEEKIKVLDEFQARISQGFDKDLQDLVLGSKVFPVLESILCDDSCPVGVREKCASAIVALGQFNKDVFVGLVLMGFTIRALVSMGTACSLRVLTLLIKLIKAHLVGEMEINGDIPKLISPLNSEDWSLRAAALDCLLEVAYFGKKTVLETMLEYGLVEKLVYLQRLELDEHTNGLGLDGKLLKNEPFAGSVVKFAVQVEVGEGMEKSEKKVIKLEILRRAREVSVSEAEAATILAEILWGCYP